MDTLTLPLVFVALPDPNTEDGIIAHVLIAESKNPGHSDYDAPVVRRGCEAMKAVIDNRLHNHPEWFLAPGATTYVDIVLAPNQWAGFSRGADGRVRIADKQQRLIDEVLRRANDAPGGAYHLFVEMALSVARGLVRDPFADLHETGGVPIIGGGYGWRTDGAGAPGGRFQRIADADGGAIAGNRFFSLRQG